MAGDELPTLVPARILNEHVYCPRLAYLEWVGQGFRDNAETVEGTIIHRRVDRKRGRTPDPEELEDGGEEPPPSTSVSLSSERLELTAKLDMVEVTDGRARPLEYKRGRPRSAEQPLWPPELIQLGAQGLLLREAGYTVDELEVYFAETRTRHRVPLTDELVAEVKEALVELRENALAGTPPPPLVDSPKCPHCSLVGICLPDETNYLKERAPRPSRRLISSDPAAKPMYALTQGSRVAKRQGRAVLQEEGEQKASARLIDISHLAVFGNVDISSALLRELFDRGVPVLWHSYGGWLSGVATGMPPGNVELRMRQHRAAAIGAPELAAEMVRGKIRNSRTLLLRLGRDGEGVERVVDQLKDLAERARQTDSLDSLLGVEGTAARLYFSQLGSLVKRGGLGEFAFEQRTRRPPRDRINATLSFLYSMLVKDTTVAVLAAGMDPYVGVFHRPKFGRPALALDLAEEFRPLVADSVALTAINNEEIQPGDFIERSGAFSLTSGGRKKLIGTYERRMEAELTHPIFGYKASYRRTLEIQARLLASVLVGDTPEYRSLTTR